MKFDYNCVVIGSGSAGLSAIEWLHSLKIKSCMIEKYKTGGDCSHSGCVPSKAFIHASKTVHGLKENNFLAQEESEKLSKINIKADMTKVYDYVQHKIESIYALETPEVLRKKGMEVIMDEAEFIDKHTIKLIKENREITSKHFIVATGADGIEPKFDGFKDLNALGYKEVWNLKESLPETMIFIGAGPIACELGQAFSRLGTKVTIVASMLLRKEHKDSREIIEKQFQKEGIEFVAGRPKKAYIKDDKKVIVMPDGKELIGDEVFYSIGREPVLPKGLKELDIEIGNRGGLVVNSKLQSVSHSNIYSAGDCINDNPQFTHLAGLQGYICVRNMFLASSDNGLVALSCPRVTYTYPEIGAVGIQDEKEAQLHHAGKIETIRWEGMKNDRAQTDNAQDISYIDLIIEKSGGIGAKILGGRAVGPRAGETISEISLAINSKISIGDFAQAMRAYPTYNFELMRLGAEASKERFLKSTTYKLAKFFG